MAAGTVSSSTGIKKVPRIEENKSSALNFALGAAMGVKRRQFNFLASAYDGTLSSPLKSHRRKDSVQSVYSS